MNSRVDQKLLVQQDDHILDCPQYLGLDSGWAVGFAEPDECAEHIWEA